MIDIIEDFRRLSFREFKRLQGSYPRREDELPEPNPIVRILREPNAREVKTEEWEGGGSEWKREVVVKPNSRCNLM